MKWTAAKSAICALVLTIGVGASETAHGQAADSLLDLLVRKGIITDKELKEMKEQVDGDMARAMNRANKTKVATWIDELKWSNDLRLRGEFFDNEDQSNNADRLRFRYRLRLGFEAKFVDWATVGFRLASGATDDPVSTNETFDDMFANDPITIDLAYVTIRPPQADWVTVTAGKMNNPIWQPSFNSPLVYDGDVTPEGVAEQLVWKFGQDQRHSLFLNAAQFVINEISGSSDTDGYLFDVQGGGDFKFGKDPKKPVVRAKIAGGFFWTDNADQGVLINDSPNRGNAVKASGTTTNFLSEFKVLTVRGDLAWKLSDQPFFGTPAVMTFSGEYAKNLTDAYKNLSGAVTNISPDQTEGWTGQIAFGSNRKKAEWQIAYQYKHLEADAVFDSLTDSDWGTGGTDRKGHVIKATYNLQEWWQLGLTALITEKISDRLNSGHNMSAPRAGEELLRVQVDSVFKF